MSDPRTLLRETLDSQLRVARLARDTLWDDYWQRRRVVVVPDVTIAGNVFAKSPKMEGWMTPGDIADGNVNPATVIRDCIARLKAARDKESTNRNLSTLLVVILKVQKDLETLLNGANEP